MKAGRFSDFVAKDTDHLVDRLDQALLWAMDRTKENKKTAPSRQDFRGLL
jgi:hypothetical protein